MDAVLGNALEVLRIVAILISPAMPATAAEIWRRIGVEGDPTAVRLPDSGRLGGLPRGCARREGRSPLPAAQGMSGWFDSHCHVQEEYLGGGEGTVAVVLVLAARSGRRRPPRLHRHRRVDVGPSGRRGARRAQQWQGAARVGLHRFAPARGDRRRRRCGRTARAGDALSVTALSWRSASAAWTTTTSTRRATAQRAAFAAQIALAHARDLALVIHARDAWDDLFDVLAAEGVPARTILHCFTGGPDGTGPLPTRRHVRVVQRHHHIQECVGHPRGRSALSARPIVGGNRQSVSWRRCRTGDSANEPSLLPLVGATVAAVKGCAVDAIAQSSAAAAAAAFAIPA